MTRFAFGRAARISASAATSFGLSTAMRMTSAPAISSSSTCRIVAGTSCVRVAAIDCTAIGFDPPMVTFPIRTGRVLRTFTAVSTDWIPSHSGPAYHRGMPLEIYDEALLRRAFHHASQYLGELPERPVTPRATRDELMKALSVPLSEDGEDDVAVLDALAKAAERGTMGTASPRFFGFVIGGSLPVTVATDWLVSAWDQNTGIYVASPISAVLEDIVREWLLDILHLPREAGVGFTTGGMMSNFTCLAAARHAVLRNAGWNVEENGLQGAPKVNIVLSAESHITIDVALRYLGFGTKAVRIPTDEQGRMRAGELRSALRKLSGPTIVCSQAGNVNTGAFDPLRQIGQIANERNAWLHVDGAFGLWARASAR